ncbi:MAG: type II secretion system F family protein, partial [bacterium]|nr:type II secretion system F family protein [bacterium]
LYKIPIIGPLLQKIMFTELTRTLGLLVGAGVSIIEALNIAVGIINNQTVAAEVRKIAKQVEKGFPVSVAFAEAGSFPPLMGQMIAVGEETGKLDEVLSKLSHFYEVESEQQVKVLTTAIEPLIMIILGIGVGFLVWTIILPIYDITNKF